LGREAEEKGARTEKEEGRHEILCAAGLICHAVHETGYKGKNKRGGEEPI